MLKSDLEKLQELDQQFYNDWDILGKQFVAKIINWNEFLAAKKRLDKKYSLNRKAILKPISK